MRTEWGGKEVLQQGKTAEAASGEGINGHNQRISAKGEAKPTTEGRVVGLVVGGLKIKKGGVWGGNSRGVETKSKAKKVKRKARGNGGRFNMVRRSPPDDTNQKKKLNYCSVISELAHIRFPSKTGWGF